MNGKNKISVGCEFGRFTREKADETREDVNKMGAKLDKIFTLLVSTLVTMIGSIITGILIFYITRK